MAAIKSAMLISVGAVALCLFLLAPAEARTFLKEKVPFAETICNPCTGEDVDLQGTIFVLISGEIAPNGSAHLEIHLNAQNVKGEGQTSGLQYRGAGAANLIVNANISDCSPLVVNGVLVANLVSQGSANDLKVKIRLHITVNANGEVSVCMVSFEPTCK